MAELAKDFEAQADIWAWKKQYHGVEGYRRMYEEVTSSFFKEFPELKGRVAVYNFANSTEQEFDRIAHETGIARTYFSGDPDEGKADTEYTPNVKSAEDFDNERRVVVYGAGPKSKGDFNKLTPADIGFMAFHLTHELYHGADLILNDTSNTAGDYNTQKWLESFADAGRVSLAIRNMGRDPDNVQSLKDFTVAYDYYSPTASQEVKYVELKTPGLKGEILRAAPDRYDNGELISKIYSETPIQRDGKNYAFEGWRATFDQVSKARAEWPAVQKEAMPYQTVSAKILGEAAERYKLAAVKDLEPLKDKIQATYKLPLDKFVNDVFNDSVLYDALKNPAHPVIQEAAPIILKHQNDFVDWARKRTDFLPGGERLVAAHDYGAGRTSEAGLYKPTDLNIYRGTESAALSYLKTGDPLDKKAVDMLKSIDWLSPEAMSGRVRPSEPPVIPAFAQPAASRPTPALPAQQSPP